MQATRAQTASQHPSTTPLAGRAAVALSAAALILAAVTTAVTRAEKYTPADSAGGLFLLTWAVGTWAILLWVAATWGAAARWRSATPGARGRAAAETVLAAAVIAATFALCAPFGSATV